MTETEIIAGLDQGPRRLLDLRIRSFLDWSIFGDMKARLCLEQEALASEAQVESLE